MASPSPRSPARFCHKIRFANPCKICMGEICKNQEIRSRFVSMFRRFGIVASLFLVATTDRALARRNKVVSPFGGISDKQLALHTSLTTVCETAALVGVVEGCKALVRNENLPFLFHRKIAGLEVLQLSSLWIVVFGSGVIRALIDGGFSAATQQIVNPNEVPSDAGDWYSSLQKPFFNPPGWLFPIMWLLIVRPTQLIALSRLANTITWKQLMVFAFHSSLGDTWNQVFFAYRRVRLGAVVISMFWMTLVAATIVFGSIERTAGLFLLPSIGWVTVASALNLEILRLNGN